MQVLQAGVSVCEDHVHRNEYFKQTSDITMKESALLAEYMAHDVETPTTYMQAMKSKNSKDWSNACDDEIK